METKRLNLEGFTVTIGSEYPVFHPWQLLAMRYLWNAKKPAGSREVYEALLHQGINISRASVINFLEDMRQSGVLGCDLKTGKGGYHALYTTVITSSQLYSALSEAATNTLKEAGKQ